MEKRIYFGLISFGNAKLVKIFEAVPGDLKCLGTEDYKDGSTMQLAKRIFERETGNEPDTVVFVNLLNL